MRSQVLLLGMALFASGVSVSQAPVSSQPRTAGAHPSASTVPELILFNGTIYTGNGFASGKPQTVQAIAIAQGKVLATGSSDAIRRLAGPETKQIDLNVGTTSNIVFPGFNDAHTHLGSAGQTKLNLDLTGIRSLQEMLKKVQAFASSLPAGHWITGGNWDHTFWPGKSLPTRQELDRVTAGHPAFLDRIDGHIAIANSEALAAAHINGSTAVPPGGAIDLDSTGQPTGILRESAKELVSKIIPPPTHAERARGDALAIEDAIRHGVTSVQDLSDWEDFLVFEEMEKQGKLHLRISEWLPFRAPLHQLEAMRAHHDPHDPMLHTGMLKGFMDGSLGSRTAALKAPYADDPRNTGLPQFTQDELNRLTVERARAGFQIGFHAIGDKAAAMALTAFDQPGVPRTGRNRVEHAQVVDPDDIARFARLGVIASMQPNHLLTDMNWAQDRLGAQRAAYSYAWKAFLDAGVPLAFGTDYPVEPVTPFRGLYAAVTRKNEAGTKTYYPENRVTRGQALAAYTQGSAYAEFAEDHKGKLVPGYDADLIIVDRDLYHVPAPLLLTTKVRATYVAGRPVYSSRASAQ